MTAPKDLWSNEETWLVQLWLMDNKDASQIAKNAAREAWDSAKADQLLSRVDNAAVALAHWLKDSIESNNPLAGRDRDMYVELMKNALDRVNWREIARHWIDELAS
jgi:hypothetical protein